MLTVVMSLGKMVRVQSMIVLIHRTIQQVLWIITHELSDPGQGKKKLNSSTHTLRGFRDYAPVVSTLNTRWFCVTVLVRELQ